MAPLWLRNGLTSVTAIVEWCIDLLVENEYMQICLALGLVPIGFWIFGKARESVGGE